MLLFNFFFFSRVCVISEGSFEAKLNRNGAMCEAKTNDGRVVVTFELGSGVSINGRE